MPTDDFHGYDLWRTTEPEPFDDRPSRDTWVARLERDQCTACGEVPRAYGSWLCAACLTDERDSKEDR